MTLKVLSSKMFISFWRRACPFRVWSGRDGSFCCLDMVMKGHAGDRFGVLFPQSFLYAIKEIVL